MNIASQFTKINLTSSYKTTTNNNSFKVSPIIYVVGVLACPYFNLIELAPSRSGHADDVVVYINFIHDSFEQIMHACTSQTFDNHSTTLENKHCYPLLWLLNYRCQGMLSQGTPQIPCSFSY